MTEPSSEQEDVDADDVEAEDVDPTRRPEYVTANTEVHANAWQETIEDMWELEEELQEAGWTTIETAAGHTGPASPEHGDEHWGLNHIVPDSDAEAIGEAVENGEFPEYDVYRRTVDGNVFEVTVLRDPGTETAILIAGQFPIRQSLDLAAHAEEVGHVYTVVQHLSGDVVAKVRHDDPMKFFPDEETRESYAGSYEDVEVLQFDDEDDEE